MPDVERRVGVVEKNVVELNTTVVDQATDLTTLAAQVLELENSISALQTRVNSLESDMTAVKAQVTQLAAEVTELKTKVASLEGTVASLQGTVSALQQQLAALQAIANELQTKLNALNTLSSLSSGVKRLLSWVQLPTFQAYRIPFVHNEAELTCPIGVPLQAMMFSPTGPLTIKGMLPTLSKSVNPFLDTATPLDIAAPGGIRIFYEAGEGPNAGGPFHIMPFVLCLNIDGLTAMTPDLSTPIVP